MQSVYKTGEEFNPSRIEAIYNCFVCGSCQSWCAGAEIGHYDIPELMKFARRDIVEKGMAPAIVQEIKDQLMAVDNPYGIDKSQSFASGISKQKADVLYLAGGEVNYCGQEIAEAALKIFKKLDISFTMLNDEPTSGKLLDILGYQEEAKIKATGLFERIKATGCKTIVVADPLDYDALIRDYPQWGLELEPAVKVVHISQYIAAQLKSGMLNLKKINNQIVTLTDSEFLRFNKVFDAPREVILSVAGDSFKEFQWNREKLHATGEAAITFNDKRFEKGEALGKKISDMAKHVEADLIITLSAIAKTNISKSTNIKTVDFTEFVASLLK